MIVFDYLFVLMMVVAVWGGSCVKIMMDVTCNYVTIYEACIHSLISYYLHL